MAGGDSPDDEGVAEEGVALGFHLVCHLVLSFRNAQSLSFRRVDEEAEGLRLGQGLW